MHFESEYWASNILVILSRQIATDTFWPGSQMYYLTRILREYIQTQAEQHLRISIIMWATNNSHSLTCGWMVARSMKVSQKTSVLRIFQKGFVVGRSGIEFWSSNLSVVWLRARCYSNVLIHKMGIILPI